MRNKIVLATRALAVSTLLWATVILTATAGFSLEDWRYAKAVVLPATGTIEGFVELVPDTEVFAAAAPGLADLRIVSGNGVETPYKLEVGLPERQRVAHPVTLRDAGYVAGQHDTFVAVLGQPGLLHNEIEFFTDAKDDAENFRRTAVVETSDDGATWVKVAEQQVFAFTVEERAFTARETKARYPQSTAQYLRVRVLDDGEGSLGRLSATVYSVAETLAKEMAWPVSGLNVRQDAERRATLVTVDLGQPGLLAYRLDLNVGSSLNFYRLVELETSADGNSWSRAIARATIYSFDTPRFTGKSLDFIFPETASRYLRLVVYDEDSPALDINGVSAWGLHRRLVFNASPGQAYQLYYGNPDAARPSYDIEQVFPYLVTDALSQATLGPQASNSLFAEQLPPASERFPWLLPAVIALAAVLVGLLVLGVVRQARKVLPPPHS